MEKTIENEMETRIRSGFIGLILKIAWLCVPNTLGLMVPLHANF